jgi:tryptophan-rich sensory protein
MAITLWKVWSLAPSPERNLDKIKAPKEKELALTWFFIQLALNTLWSFLFFYFQWPLGAFVEIIILWIAILMTIIKFYALVPWTIWLLVPYLLWVSFAAFLNGTIAWLNA